MDFIKQKLGQIGGFIALIGVVSAVLSLFNYNLRILMWIDLWGTTVGWTIRVGLIVVGVLLLFVFGKGEDKETETKE